MFWAAITLFDFGTWNKSGDTPANPMVYHHFPVKMIFWVFQFSEKTQLITSLKWQLRVWGLLVISVDYNSCTIGLNKLQRLLKEFWWLWPCRLQQFNALLLLLLFFLLLLLLHVVIMVVTNHYFSKFNQVLYIVIRRCMIIIITLDAFHLTSPLFQLPFSARCHSEDNSSHSQGRRWSTASTKAAGARIFRPLAFLGGVMAQSMKAGSGWWKNMDLWWVCVHPSMHASIRPSVHACMHTCMHTYITFHCITLQYITLHHITSHHVTSHPWHPWHPWHPGYPWHTWHTWHTLDTLYTWRTWHSMTYDMRHATYGIWHMTLYINIYTYDLWSMVDDTWYMKWIMYKCNILIYIFNIQHEVNEHTLRSSSVACWTIPHLVCCFSYLDLHFSSGISSCHLWLPEKLFHLER